uniref:EGF-like domain-containing protein n=1 Tax=Plectus sambesii TaxID=2011161 RepID=A0A914WG84_9BILA
MQSANMRISVCMLMFLHFVSANIDLKSHMSFNCSDTANGVAVGDMAFVCDPTAAVQQCFPYMETYGTGPNCQIGECDNFADEECQEGYIKCDKCKCVLDRSACWDTYVVCPGGGFNSFTCKDGNGCIPWEWVTDGYPDCDDESDENECDFPDKHPRCTEGMTCVELSLPDDYTCTCGGPGYHTMPDGRCVYEIDWRISQCSNMNMTAPGPTVSIQCGNGTCVPFTKFRDCHVDCDDGMDEACYPGQVKCDDCKCVAPADAKYQCLDQTLNKLCLMDQTPYDYNIYHCRDGTCILWEWLEDNDPDCADDEDEKCVLEPCVEHAYCARTLDDPKKMYSCVCEEGYYYNNNTYNNHYNNPDNDHYDHSNNDYHHHSHNNYQYHHNNNNTHNNHYDHSNNYHYDHTNDDNNHSHNNHNNHSHNNYYNHTDDHNNHANNDYDYNYTHNYNYYHTHNDHYDHPYNDHNDHTHNNHNHPYNYNYNHPYNDHNHAYNDYDNNYTDDNHYHYTHNYNYDHSNNNHNNYTNDYHNHAYNDYDNNYTNNNHYHHTHNYNYNTYNSRLITTEDSGNLFDLRTTLGVLFDGTAGSKPFESNFKNLVSTLVNRVEMNWPGRFRNYLIGNFDDNGGSVCDEFAYTKPAPYLAAVELWEPLTSNSKPCPARPILTTLSDALSKSATGCYQIIYTSGPASDYTPELYDRVMQQIMETKCQVDVVAFADGEKCFEQAVATPGVDPMKTIIDLATVSSGNVFNVTQTDPTAAKAELDQMFDLIGVQAESIRYILDAGAWLSPGEHIRSIPVDVDTKNITVSLTACPGAKIEIRDNRGVWLSSENLNWRQTVSTENNQAVTIVDIMGMTSEVCESGAGYWVVKVTGESCQLHYRVTGSGGSDFNYDFTFNDIDQTTYNLLPALGVASEVKVDRVQDPRMMDYFTDVVSLMLNDGSTRTISLFDHSTKFTMDSIQAPNDMFYVKVAGLDGRNGQWQRYSRTQLKTRPLGDHCFSTIARN